MSRKMRAVLVRLTFSAALLWSGVAWAQPEPSGEGGAIQSGGSVSTSTVTPAGGSATKALSAWTQQVNQSLFYAQSYGSCTWSVTADVGPCINAAIAAAATAGGGEVVVPAGSYGIATTVRQSTPGVALVGYGVGDPRDSIQPGAFQAITRLVWIGAAAGGPVADIEPVNTSAEDLYKADVRGIVFDCAGLANIGLKVSQVSHSKLDVGGAECRTNNVLFTTTSATDGPGTQDNDIWVYSRQTNSYPATGILFDGGSGSIWNTSFNRIHAAYAWFAQGDGIIVGNADNNIFDDVRGYPNPGANGSPAVVAGGGYTAPNGQTITGLGSNSNLILHASMAIRVTGSTSGAVVTTGTHAGTAVFSAASFTTTGTPGYGGQAITASSSTGLAAGETLNCGSGSGSGVMPGNTIVGVSSTTLTLNGSLLSTVASGTTCQATYGLTSSAVEGNYTLTATSGTTFNLTAPSGGNSQTGVALSGGVLTFTDAVIPISGTATAGDTWTIAVPYGATYFSLRFLDEANSLIPPMFEPGSSGDYETSANPYPIVIGKGGVSINLGVASGPQSFAAGLGASASGYQGVAIGTCGSSGPFAVCLGPGNTSSGYGTFAVGHNVTAGGIYDAAFGQYTNATGSYSLVAGQYTTDRGDSAEAYGLTTLGQTRSTVLSAALSSASATRLTVDSAAAGASNGLRIPTGTLAAVIVDAVACTDTTNRANWAVWRIKQGALVRGSGSPTYSGDDSTATAPDISGGAGSGGGGSTLQIAADTTNNVLSLSVAWPNSNATHCAASARVVEAQ